MTPSSQVRDRSAARIPEVPRRRRWIVLLIMGVATAAVLALYYSPLLGVRSVEVGGAATLKQEDVVAASGVRVGEPMLQIQTGDVTHRLEAVPKIASAQVHLGWPSTVRLDIVERTPVAFVTAGSDVQLVDAHGVVYENAPQPPDLPELRVPAGDPALPAAVLVVGSLPATLRAQVAAVQAPSPNDIRLLLKDGREVDWGDTSNAQYKAEIVPVLLTRPGKVYDVRSPNLPTVSAS